MATKPTGISNASNAVAAACAAWSTAPLHIKAMAGAYVGPLVDALKAINTELQALRELSESESDGNQKIH